MLDLCVIRLAALRLLCFCSQCTLHTEFVCHVFQLALLTVSPLCTVSLAKKATRSVTHRLPMMLDLCVIRLAALRLLRFRSQCTLHTVFVCHAFQLALLTVSPPCTVSLAKMASRGSSSDQRMCQMFTVHRLFSRFDHEEWDPLFAGTALYPPVGYTFIYMPSLASNKDCGWWKGLLFNENFRSIGWIHPGVLQPIVCDVDVDRDEKKYASNDRWYYGRGGCQSYMLHCHRLGWGTNQQQDPDNRSHCGSCLPTLERLMQSGEFLNLIHRISVVCAAEPGATVVCLCTHGKHRSYGVAWATQSLLGTSLQNGAFTRKCRMVTHPCLRVSTSEIESLLLAAHYDGSDMK
jgi:hypothetical protein